MDEPSIDRPEWLECVYCGGEATQNEHVVPRSAGGTLTLPSCRACNLSKGRKSVAHWIIDLPSAYIWGGRGPYGDKHRLEPNVEAIYKRVPLLVQRGIVDSSELFKHLICEFEHMQMLSEFWGPVALDWDMETKVSEHLAWLAAGGEE